MSDDASEYACAVCGAPYGGDSFRNTLVSGAVVCDSCADGERTPLVSANAMLKSTNNEWKE